VDSVEITAGRQHLRAWQPGDADAVHAACQDPDVQRWTSVPSPYTREDARVFVEEVSPAEWDAGTGAHFAVLDATTASLLASVGLLGINRRRLLAELGYWCAPQARGRGVVTQAATVLCRWGFAELGLQRIAWTAQLDNAASWRVAQKIGFRHEGIARNGLDHRGTQVDALVAGLVPADLV